MRNVAIVSPHFVPSNLASVHRARLWALNLRDFGWNPIIVTTHFDYYEESPDWSMIDPALDGIKVVRTKALPVRPVRLVGDLGIRSLPWHYRALSEIAATDQLDFVLITIPSNFSAVLGRLFCHHRQIPFGIDYQDPWVHEWPGSDKPFSKAWISYQLSQVLEPWAVKHCSLIVGVADGYIEGVVNRNPGLKETARFATMPIGIEPRDFEGLEADRRVPTLLRDAEDKYKIVYAGAYLPHGREVLVKLFQGLAALRDVDEKLAKSLHFFFIGTGRGSKDRAEHEVLPIAEKHGVTSFVSEHPSRMTYGDTLRHLTNASAVLIIGSDRPHYSPSKVFQAIASGRPVLSLLHQGSPANDLLQACGAGRVLSFSDPELIDSRDVATTIIEFVREFLQAPYNPDLGPLREYTAKENARRLAFELDAATLRQASSIV